MNAPETIWIRQRLLVSGEVQGVGFRMFTRQWARELGVAGSVRNLADRRVEVLAAGTRAAIDVLERHLNEGPRGARVKGVERLPIPPGWRPPDDDDFEIHM